MNKLINNLPHALKPVAGAQTVALTISNTAIKLTEAAGAPLALTIAEGAQYFLVTVEGADVRVCPEGGTPTSAIGHPIAADTTVLLSLAEVTSGKWIRSGGTDATLQVTQYTT